MRHLRAWEKQGTTDGWLIEWNRKRIASVRKGFEKAAEKAGIGRNVTPHILRHTCATWMLQAGGDEYAVAGYLSMTVDMLREVYGHYVQNHVGATSKGFKPKS